MPELVRASGCDNTQRRGDVVFVHGLNGDPRDYWGVPSSHWPAWLGEELPDVGVWSLGYENAAFKPRWFSVLRFIFGRGFAMPLEFRARNVLLRFEVERIGEKPLIFITHSMGGLLVKQLLRTANESHPSSPWKQLLENTKGVCFIGTPHIGADLAKWVSYFGKLLGTTVAVADLSPHLPLLIGLNSWYRDFVHPRNVQTLTFFETRPLGPGGLVVEPGDADPGVPLAGFYPLDDDHRSICKPKSKQAEIHLKTLGFVRDCLNFQDAHPVGPEPVTRWAGQPFDVCRPWNVPHPRNPFFTGRVKVVADLRKKFAKQRKAATQAISGLGGSGKTQVAVEYAYRYRDKYKAVLWLNAESTLDLKAGFSEIARLMRLPHAEHEPDEAVLAGKQWLVTESSWLLVFDNADDPELLRPFLPDAEHGHILVTSRAQDFQNLGVLSPIELEQMTLEDATAFLLRRCDREKVDAKEQDAAERLARELDGLPLALEQAAAYIAAGSGVTFQSYLQSYRSEGLKRLEARHPVLGNYPWSVVSTWVANFESGARGIADRRRCVMAQCLPRARCHSIRALGRGSFGIWA